METRREVVADSTSVGRLRRRRERLEKLLSQSVCVIYLYIWSEV